jgi:hypothetical protein
MDKDTQQKLFNYMRDEHQIFMLQSDMLEIERIVSPFTPDQALAFCKQQRENCANKYEMEIDSAYYSEHIKQTILNAPTPEIERLKAIVSYYEKHLPNNPETKDFVRQFAHVITEHAQMFTRDEVEAFCKLQRKLCKIAVVKAYSDGAQSIMEYSNSVDNAPTPEIPKGGNNV